MDGVILGGLLVATGSIVALALWWRGRRRSSATRAPAGDGVSTGRPQPTSLAAVLEATRRAWAARIEGALGRGDVWEGIEEALLQSDVGLASTSAVVEGVRRRVPATAVGDAVRGALREAIHEILPAVSPVPMDRAPWVVLVVGVNGTGKTTTIGKLAHQHREAGRQVLLIAADTFRAAAADQLEVWAERTGSQLVRTQQGGDPAAVVHDGLQAAVARKVDVVLVDTAGRLHTHGGLMDELRKVRRIVEREIPGAPHEVLMVIDGTTGQNALRQARTFADATGVTGVVLTKLDGTAKGGVAIAIGHEFGLPIRWIGVGEGVSDLRPFERELFVDALVGEVPSIAATHRSDV